MGISKQGIITSNSLYEPEGSNILSNSGKYTIQNPYVLTGTGGDIYIATDMVTRVTPGATYYLTCEIYPEWSASHGYSTGAKGKGTIWLYLCKTYDTSNYEYDSPICFTSSNSIKNGVWKYTIPSGYNMARVRLNTYSDGTNPVTCKFWDINLIPEKYYVSQSANLPSLKIGNDFITAKNFIEL